MSKKLDNVAREVVEALTGAGGRLGRGIRRKSDAQASKVRDIAEQVRRRDREMADGASTASRTRRAGEDGPVQALDVDSYAGNRSRAETGDRLEHDHIPSAAALIKAKEHELGRPLLPHEERDIYNQASTIELPTDVHRDSRTYGGRNTSSQVGGDAADLSAAAELDYADRRKLLLDAGYDAEAVDRAIQKLRDRNGSRGI